MFNRDRSIPGLARRMSARSSLGPNPAGVTLALLGDLLKGVTDPA